MDGAVEGGKCERKIREVQEGERRIRKERERDGGVRGVEMMWMQNLSTGYPGPIWRTHEQDKYPVREAKKSWPDFEGLDHQESSSHRVPVLVFLTLAFNFLPDVESVA
jgi:hypothetical protein